MELRREEVCWMISTVRWAFSFGTVGGEGLMGSLREV
jgi:hypothetical protein